MQNHVSEGVPSSGQRYPLDTNCFAPTGEDRDLCDQRLSEESLELFQVAGGGSDILWSARDDLSSQEMPQRPEFLETVLQTQGSVLRRRFVASEDIDKPGSLMTPKQKWMHVVFNIQPVFSWGHLAITEYAFRHILASLRTFTPFLRIAHAFGAKTNDKQRMRDVAYYHMHSSCDYEFCYIIRYFELNGRQRGDPWSLRQTGVYQRFQSDQRSAWVLLNLSSYINDRVTAAVTHTGSADKSLQPSPLLVHMFIITAAVRNWSMYIENLRKRVQKFEEKSYSSRVDTIYLDDYELLFTDVQAMVSLSETLDTAKAVIQGQKGVMSRCGDLHMVLRRKASKQDDSKVAHTLQLLRSDIQHHHEAVIAMARTTSHITQLVLAILASRSNAKLSGSITMIQMSVFELQSQSRQTAQDTAGLLNATAKGHEDATKIKTMAQIATMFLPASLIASIFSSTMLGDSGNNTSNVGMYFAITIPLLLVTLLFLILLEKDLPLALLFRRLSLR